MTDYKEKYLKYKIKYFNLKQIAGAGVKKTSLTQIVPVSNVAQIATVSNDAQELASTNPKIQEMLTSIFDTIKLNKFLQQDKSTDETKILLKGILQFLFPKYNDEVVEPIIFLYFGNIEM